MLNKEMKIKFWKTDAFADVSLFSKYNKIIEKGYNYSEYDNTYVSRFYRNHSKILQFPDELLLFLRNIIGIVLVTGCCPDIFNYKIVLKEPPYYGNYEGEVGAHEHGIQIMPYTGKQNIEELPYSLSVKERLPKFELICKEDDKHKIIIYKSLYNESLIVITNKLTWEILFKTLLIDFSNIEPVLDTPEKKKTYTTVMNLIQAMCTRDDDLFNNNIDVLLNEIIPIAQKERYSKFFTFDQTERIKNIKMQRLQKENEINRWLGAIADSQKKINELNLLYEAILNNKYADANEIAEYLINNPYIEITYSTHYRDEGYINLKVTAPLLYYDEDYLEAIIENQEITSDNSPKKWLLYDYVFLQKKCKIWTQCDLEFDLKNYSVAPIDTRYEKEYLPHPHIAIYHCLGNHNEQIRRWREVFDYIGCFEQIISMAMNMNFTDSIVTERLVDELCNNNSGHGFENISCFEDENGVLYTFKELYEKVFNSRF